MAVFDLRARSRYLTIPLALGITLALVATAFLVSAGTPIRDTAIALGLLAPIAFYFAIVRPIVFPYGLYILLIPFDTLLGVSSAGTLTKMLGIATGMLLFFYCLRTRHTAAPVSTVWLLAAFLAWMTVSLLWAVNPELAAPWLVTYFGLAMLYAALALTPISLADFRFVLGATVGAFLIAAVVGIVSFHNLPQVNPHDLRSLADHRLVLRIGAFYIDPNDYADAFIFPIAIVMTLALRTRWLALKLGGAAILACMTAAMVMSGSRESLIALVVLIAYYAWRSRYRLQMLILSLVISVAAMPFAATLMTRFQSSLSTGGQGRTSIWAVGLTAVKHYGLVGSGIGSFPEVYNRFYLSVAQIYSFGWSAPPHNLLLHFWVELGIVGVALAIWIFVENFRMLRTIGRTHPLYDYRIMIEGGLIGVCTSSFFIDTFNAKWAWLVLATAAQLVYVASTYRRPVTPARPNDAHTHS
jgi:O-antigen ligase